MRVEDLYDAAQASGLLTSVQTGAGIVWCGFRAPDEAVLDGLSLSRDYAIEYPASRAQLAAGETVSIGGQAYRVREVKALRDGTEVRATLSRL